ncbi:DNA alkylation damage repair protein AlkB [Rhodobacter aestuarii]|uniref:Alkylated DNA repair protein (DNA oxidative demethylase) n=1 Tax=Rhodobacter aestuarii TaxID=453582 RepID=A0A1N7PSK6_9RHOB|nr:alpha-ketoglutarate-dependent dioxygenase AlkB [Rhodobacter aestuarii]PTV94200.1 DNA alkylation damage repair protein AlkB [Rhodobacter aestuarii]SIT13525.1 alkylated DNA repair protein (DNA oxidative demethylase) [Rhodobacter aestuarii]
MTQISGLTPRPKGQDLRGFVHYPGWLTAPEQAALVADLRAVVAQAPLFSPMTPYGRPMSVRMTSAGRFGWVSDRRGYRYSETHPEGMAWPAIPQSVLDIWQAVAGSARAPECCLINFYGENAKMGMHQDRDEADFAEPVVSISLGDDGLFRIGNETRGGRTQSLWLRSGDVMVMGGTARPLYHGIDRIAPGTSPLLPQGGRINLTLRVAT